MSTIIHINPDSAVQQWVKEVLEPWYTLVSVADAPTAIQYCAMIHPNLIIINADQPDFRELTTRLKMFMPQTPMLVLAQQTITLPQVLGDRDIILYQLGSADELRDQVKMLLAPAESPDISLTSKLENQVTALGEANQRLASLNAISALIGTSLDLGHLTDEILQQIQKTIDFDSATLFLLKGNLLEAAASRGLYNYRRGLNAFTRSEKNSAWLVVQNKLPLVIGDVTHSDYWEPAPELNQVRAWLGAPLIYKDRVVGVLTLDKNEPDAFSEADARYVFTLAFQIATAVENAQLFEEWESQAARLKLINEVNQQLATILDIGHLYRTLAQALVDRLQYERVTIFEMNLQGTALLLRVCCRRDQPSAVAQSLAENEFSIKADTGLIGTVVETGRPLLEKDNTDKIGTLPGMAVRAVLIMPIFVNSRVEVVINIDSQTPKAFNDHDLWTMSSLAAHTAAIIENARLYHHVDAYSDKLQRTVVARTQRLQAIKNISQVISQGVDVDELLQVVGQRIQQVFVDAVAQPIQVATALLNGSKLTRRVIYDIEMEQYPDKYSDKSFRLNLGSVIGQVIAKSRSMVLHGVE